jgi:acyl-CoA thioester hydrolase
MDFESWCDNNPMSRFCQEARLRVRYAETDQMGVAYYANYLIWMEVGRVEYCKALGFRYRAVVEARCRYLHPARYDDEVIVKTWIEEATRRMVRFGYEMSEAGGGRKLASGETKHLFCTRQLRPARLPEKYHPLFGIA